MSKVSVARAQLERKNGEQERSDITDDKKEGNSQTTDPKNHEQPNLVLDRRWQSHNDWRWQKENDDITKDIASRTGVPIDGGVEALSSLSGQYFVPCERYW